MNTSTQQRPVWRRAAAFVRESLRDSDRDYTSGRIGRALGLLAIPMMLEMSMESVFAVVDIAFVYALINFISTLAFSKYLDLKGI